MQIDGAATVFPREQQTPEALATFQRPATERFQDT